MPFSPSLLASAVTSKMMKKRPEPSRLQEIVGRIPGEAAGVLSGALGSAIGGGAEALKQLYGVNAYNQGAEMLDQWANEGNSQGVDTGQTTPVATPAPAKPAPPAPPVAQYGPLGPVTPPLLTPWTVPTSPPPPKEPADRSLRGVDTSKLKGQALADAFGFSFSGGPHTVTKAERAGTMFAPGSTSARFLPSPGTKPFISRELLSDNPDKLTADRMYSGGPPDRMRSRSEDAFRESELVRANDLQQTAERNAALDSFDPELNALMRQKQISDLQTQLMQDDAVRNELIRTGVPVTKENLLAKKAEMVASEFNDRFFQINEMLRKKEIDPETFDKMVNAAQVKAAMDLGTFKYTGSSNKGNGPVFNVEAPS